MTGARVTERHRAAAEALVVAEYGDPAMPINRLHAECLRRFETILAEHFPAEPGPDADARALAEACVDHDEDLDVFECRLCGEVWGGGEDEDGTDKLYLNCHAPACAFLTHGHRLLSRASSPCVSVPVRDLREALMEIGPGTNESGECHGCGGCGYHSDDCPWTRLSALLPTKKK